MLAAAPPRRRAPARSNLPILKAEASPSSQCASPGTRGINTPEEYAERGGDQRAQGLRQGNKHLFSFCRERRPKI
ncbi:MAG: hypothetical protein ABSC37_05955 [Xanthobacteraceae bacterium]|jgi:hypothetical protein